MYICVLTITAFIGLMKLQLEVKYLNFPRPCCSRQFEGSQTSLLKSHSKLVDITFGCLKNVKLHQYLYVFKPKLQMYQPHMRKAPNL